MSFQRVTKFDQRARELADRHYSRQSKGNRQFMPPGRTLVLYQPGAVWGAVEHLDPRGRRVWRCSIFRNETDCFIIAGWRLLRIVPAGHGRPLIHILAAPWP